MVNDRLVRVAMATVVHELYADDGGSLGLWSLYRRVAKTIGQWVSGEQWTWAIASAVTEMLDEGYIEIGEGGLVSPRVSASTVDWPAVVSYLESTAPGPVG